MFVRSSLGAGLITATVVIQALFDRSRWLDQRMVHVVIVEPQVKQILLSGLASLAWLHACPLAPTASSVQNHRPRFDGIL